MFYRETLGLRFPEKEVLCLQARARIPLIAGLFQKLVSQGVLELESCEPPVLFPAGV